MIANAKRKAALAGVLLVLTALANPAMAQQTTAKPPVTSSSGASPKLVGKYKDWAGYSMQDGSRLVCFIVSEPKSKNLSDSKAQRGDPFFLVTRWAPGQTLQPSIIMGYPQASDKKASIKIGNDTFEMFVDGDGAWMESEGGDKKLTEAMRKGSTMTITGQSGRGTKSTDRYSLAGISQALDKLTETCQ